MNSKSEFYKWIDQMQIPEHCIPNKNETKLLLSNSSLVLDEITTLVGSVQDTARIKNELKVHHHDRFKENKGQMPPQIKLYADIKATKDECKSLKREFDRNDKICEEKGSKVNEIEMGLLETQSQIEHVTVKNALLQMKQKDLQKKLDNELEKQDGIVKAFAPGTYKTGDQIHYFGIEDIIIECHKELNEFYSRSQNETDSEAAQEQIWQSMRKLVDPIPRHLLWRGLISSQERLVSELKKLSTDMKSRVMALKPKTKREQEEASLNYAITSLNGKELLSQLKIRKELKPKIDSLTLGNTEALESFACVIYDNLDADHSNIDNQDQIIEEFVLTIAKHLVLDAELNYGEQMRNKISEEHTRIQQQLDYQGTKMNMEETQRLYGQLESQVHELELDLAKIYQVKNKLETERKYNEDFTRNKFKMNTTVMGSNNVTTTFNSVAALGMNQSVEYRGELDIFEQLPIEVLKYQSSSFQNTINTFPYALTLNLSPSEISNMPCCQFTMQELLEYVRMQGKFMMEIESLKKPLEVGTKATPVSEDELNARLNQNFEAITELIDKFSILFKSTEERMENCLKLKDFCKENPLKKYVPASVLFSGRPFNYYLNEFNMQFHLLKQLGDSQKN